jgi:hypothetical protein
MVDLWNLVWGKPEVDPNQLSLAIEGELTKGRPADFRTRLLIRDSVEALRNYWGDARIEKWLRDNPVRGSIEAIRSEELGEPGFPLLKESIVEPTSPQIVTQYLREIGRRVNRPLRLQVGGSIALIMTGYLSRATQDIDVVDEVPAEIRALQPLLKELEEMYKLQLTHFQSHYLPSGWDQRLHYLDSYDRLQVYTVDVYDVFLSKLFSIRTKDRSDLNQLLPKLDKDVLVDRFKRTTASMLTSPEFRKRAEDNWFVLFGEALPS